MSARDEALRIALASRGVASPEEVVAALTGPKGDIGPEGPQGIEGPTGPEGQKGDKGDPGIRGPQGEKGPKGDKGDRGAKGTKGDRGPMGPMGPQGWPGGGGGGSGGGSGSALTVKDETVSLDTAVTSIDFVGVGVTATNVGHAITVEIDGGAGSTNVYVQDSDPGAVGAGKLWVDTTTPGPPWHVQVRNATDDGWNDVLEQYAATGDIGLTGTTFSFATPDLSGFVRMDANAGFMQSADPGDPSTFAEYRVSALDDVIARLRYVQTGVTKGEVSAGPDGLSVTDGASSTGTDGQVFTAQGDGTALWEDGAGGTPAVDPGDIADPTIATAEDVALKLNALMAAMRTAGSLA